MPKQVGLIIPRGPFLKPAADCRFVSGDHRHARPVADAVLVFTLDLSSFVRFASAYTVQCLCSPAPLHYTHTGNMLGWESQLSHASFSANTSLSPTFHCSNLWNAGVYAHVCVHGCTWVSSWVANREEKRTFCLMWWCSLESGHASGWKVARLLMKADWGFYVEGSRCAHHVDKIKTQRHNTGLKVHNYPKGLGKKNN